MRRLLLLVVLALFGCEAFAINQCGYACERTDQAMVTYTKADGCVCGPKPDEERQ